MKKLLRLLTCVFTLSLLLAIPVSASGNIGIGEGGDVDEGSEDLTGKDGFTGSNIENTLPATHTNTYTFYAKLYHHWDERSVAGEEPVYDSDGNNL